MDPSPAIVGGLLLAAAFGLYGFYHSHRAVSPDDAPICRLLRGLLVGVCPRCEAVHPEATTHSGPRNFWTNFSCPECGYHMSAHIRQSNAGN